MKNVWLAVMLIAVLLAGVSCMSGNSKTSILKPSSSSSSAPAPLPVPGPASVQGPVKTIAGVAGAMRGMGGLHALSSTTEPFCRVEVTTDSGAKAFVYITKSTSITDTAGKDMTQGGKALGVKKGGRIEAKCSTRSNGYDVAVSIRCLD